VQISSLFLRYTFSYESQAHIRHLDRRGGNTELSRYSDWLRAGPPEFDSRQGPDMFLYSIASRPALGSTQSPVQWVPDALSPGVRGQRRETDRSPPSSAEVLN
jgi:hypothetical protein